FGLPGQPFGPVRNPVTGVPEMRVEDVPGQPPGILVADQAPLTDRIGDRDRWVKPADFFKRDSYIGLAEPERLARRPGLVGQAGQRTRPCGAAVLARVVQARIGDNPGGQGRFCSLREPPHAVLTGRWFQQSKLAERAVQQVFEATWGPSFRSLAGCV